MRLTGFIALTFLSLAIAAYAVAVYGLLPLGAQLPPAMRATFEANRVTVLTHVFVSALAMAIGPLQFWTRLRLARPAIHRWLGRCYLAAVLVGGLAGLFMAMHAYGGPVARLGFTGLALAWLFTGVRAYVAIRAGNVASHRRWMVRNFALTFAAVTLRLWLPASVVGGIPFELAYPVIAWLCWVPNLVLAETLFQQVNLRSHAQ